MDCQDFEHYDYLIVGAGLSGSVIARQLAEQNQKVLIIDKRPHIGGNCYDYIDENGIRINKYGAHIFHTNDERVWEYVQRFSSWSRWEHKVLSLVDDQYVPIPPNITTINMICSQNIQTSEEAIKWLSNNTIKHDKIVNSQQMATSIVGELLYEKMFKYYTFKQWDRYPEELNSSVLARIPVRTTFDDRYFSDKYQALPTNGYTTFFENIQNHPNITVKLNIDFLAIRSIFNLNTTVVYTGPIDEYFSSVGYPKLEYRSIRFDIRQIKDTNFYQPSSVVNNPGKEVPYTRTVEYKHFLNQKSPHTTIVSEISTDKGEPYYPVPNERNLKLYESYRKLAEQEERMHFVGRLANYKYFNMDEAIKNALEYYDIHFADNNSTITPMDKNMI